jgi:Ca2+-binding EF-hand superfamily protein
VGQQAQQEPGGFQSRAGGQQQGSTRSFDETDRNSDGEISRSELSAEGAASFAALDTNNDGQIDRQEYARGEQRTLNN